MELYKEKLSRFVPVLDNKTELIPGSSTMVVRHTEMAFLPEEDYYDTIPYLQEVQELAASGAMDESKRVFIVTEEENIALKVAHGYMTYPIYEAREDIYEQMEEQGFSRGNKVSLKTEDGSSFRIRIISLEGEKKKETENNTFLPSLVGVGKNDAVFFYGLEDNSSLKDKLEVVMACTADWQFVQISEQQLGSTWFRELMMDKECEVLRLNKIPDSYYEEVLCRLMKGERYQLEESLTPLRLVRCIRKKCGNRFREEDLAWGLDQAAKAARKERRRMLKAEDFSLNREETGSTLEKLKNMTGLQNMKQVAVEYAALSREQEKNGKIADLSRHTIFVGNPGSGKTVCGDMLAKILAEEGQSNGNFVIAARKDIIGEYVGHTAPKVAELFRRARYGVLFVDEAGFFLKAPERDFAGEAIKEFVRYMELYRDVVVIFALYQNEVEQWLELDAGLASRIGRVVKFEDYTDEELVQIGTSMCRYNGYEMEAGAEEEIMSYISACRQELKGKFGNAREVRKLVETAIVSKSVRCFDMEQGESENILRKEDFVAAVEKLKPEKTEHKRVIGFVAGGMEHGRKTVSYKREVS